MFDFDSLYDTGEIVFQNAIREAIDECKSRIRELRLEDDEITTDRIITDISMYAIMDRIVMTAMNDFALFVSDSLLQHIREKPEYRDFSFNVLDGSVASDMTMIYENGIGLALENSKESMALTISDAQSKGKSKYDIMDTVADEFFLTVRHKKALDNYVHSLEISLIDEERLSRGNISANDSLATESLFDGEYVEDQYDAYIDRSIEDRIDVISGLLSVAAAGSLSEETLVTLATVYGIGYGIIRKHWVHVNDTRVRDAHLAVPMMNPKGVPVGEAFDTPLGPLRYPGDPMGTIANTIHCRCHIRYEIGGSYAL